MRFTCCAFLDGCKRFFLHFPLFSHPKLVTQAKNDQPRKTCSRFLDFYCSYDTATRCSWMMFFCQDATNHCTLSESCDTPLFICRDHSAPPLLVCKHGVGLRGFRCSFANNFGALAGGAKCTNVHLALVTAGVQKARLDVHDKPSASGSADVIGYEMSPANSYCSGTGKGLAPFRSVSRVISSRRRITAARWNSSVVANLSWRSAIVVLPRSLMPASNLRGRLTCFGHGQLCI